MDVSTFIVEVLKALAWPSITLSIFLALRKPLKALLPLLIRLKYKDLELDFSRRLEEAEAEAAALPPTPPPALVADPGERLVQLAKSSPRAAILEAWIRVEHAAVEALRRRDVSPASRQIQSPLELIKLLESHKVIDSQLCSLFHDLRGLRNSAAHASRFEPAPELAEDYVRLALRLETTLSAA
jgi:hypothetical protein